MSGVEIICRNCGNESLLRREAIYEGFTKIGEKLTCAGCGHEYASEAEVSFKQKNESPRVFTEDDRSRKIEVFNDGEHRQLCRYCAHYIINPFTQFCAVHRKEVQATDSCERFEEKTEGDSSTPAI